MSRFQKATKKNSKLRLAIAGPSGAGKTFTALRIAGGLGSRIAVIDTEHGSASKYADLFEFDVCELNNHHPAQYIEALRDADKEGYEIIIIDSLSHAWYAELDLASKGKGFEGWKNVRPLERALIDAMLDSPAHIISTMRSKTEWIMEDYVNKAGKNCTAPKKVGTAPIQTSGIEYEFDIAGEMDLSHVLTLSKSRCPALSNTSHLNPGKELAETILQWLSAEPATKQPSEQTMLNNFSKAVDDQVKKLTPANVESVIDTVLKYCSAMRKRIANGDAPPEFAENVKNKLKEAMAAAAKFQPEGEDEDESNEQPNLNAKADAEWICIKMENFSAKVDKELVLLSSGNATAADTKEKVDELAGEMRTLVKQGKLDKTVLKPVGEIHLDALRLIESYRPRDMEVDG